MREVDFLPERIRQQRARRRQLVRQGYLLAAVAVVMALMAYARHGRLAEAKGQLATLHERADGLKRQIAMIPGVERQMADLLIKKRIDEELGSRADCTGVLAELCRVMPANVSLLSLELKTIELRAEAEGTGRRSRSGSAAGRRPQEPSGPGVLRRVSLKLTGLAPTDVDVANFIGQLSASCLFEDVNMGYAKTVSLRGRPAREFQANCFLAR